MTMSEAFENFITEKRVQGLAEKSITCYTDCIVPFIRELGSDFPVTSLTKAHLDRYILKLQKKDTLSKATIATYVRNIKVMLLWIEEEFEIVIGAKKVKVPRSPKKMVHVYDPDEIVMIFDSVTADSEWIVERNRAIIALMLDSGLRQNEVCTLKASDVDFKKGIIKVYGKGSKERYVPFGKLSARYMDTYRKLCPLCLTEEETFFVARRGGAMSCDSVKHFMTRLSRKLPFELSSHKLRHNYATNYCLDQLRTRGNVDVNKLQILMGHEDLATTQRYLHIATKIFALEGNFSHLDSLFVLEN